MGRARTALISGVAASMFAAALAVPALAVTAPSPSPSQSSSSTSGLPTVQLPTLNPQLVIYQAIAGILYAFDNSLITEMSGLWNPMVAGSDDLTGKETLGPGLVIDNSQLGRLWGISFGVATGSLLTLVFALTALIWIIGSALGSRHDIMRNLVYFLAAMILMGGSFFLVTQLVNVDNALVQVFNGQVTIELRSLPAFQGLGVKDPSAIQDIHDLLNAIVVLLIVVFVALELLVLFVIYFIRLILIWVLVAVAPFAFAFSIIPAGRGIVIYWTRLLVATVALKFVNVLVFTTFVVMGASSDVALLNVVLVATMLLFMISVPAALMRALGEPSGAILSAQASWRSMVHHERFRVVRDTAWSRLRGG